MSNIWVVFSITKGQPRHNTGDTWSDCQSLFLFAYHHAGSKFDQGSGGGDMINIILSPTPSTFHPAWEKIPDPIPALTADRVGF